MPNLDDFDNLLRQSSAHGLRVLLTLHAPSPSADLSGLARFWLNRGVAGLHIVSPGVSPEQAQAMADSLRKLAAGSAGQRIIVTDVDPASQANLTSPARSRPASAHPRPTSSVPLLEIDTRAAHLATFDAASLRPILSQANTRPNLLLDLRTPASAPLSSAVATMGLVSQPASLIDSAANLVLHSNPEQPKTDSDPEPPAPPPPAPPQAPPGTYMPYVPYTPPTKPRPAAEPRPVPEDPLFRWYRQLASLHHDNPALRFGSTTFLDFDAQNVLVWVTRPAPNAPRLTAPVFVICNLSSAPLQLSLAEAAKKMGLHGFYLRTLLRTDQAMGAQDLNSVSIPANGVYIGELHR